MSVKVVDASAIACVLLEEPAANSVQERIHGHILIAPTLLPYEVANACVINARRAPEKEHVFFQALEMYYRLAIPLRDVDIEGVFNLAQRTGLTSYDASYLWLAQHHNAELVTLDKRLMKAMALMTGQ
jgi:predicted nucleic acid-binding protein